MNTTDNRDQLRNNGNMDYQFDLNNSLIFDVGLNLGNKADAYLSRGAKVIGFEPQKDCFDYAMNRFSFYKSISSFSAENIALSDSIGVADFYRSSQHVLSSMSTEFIQESEKQRFKGCTWNTKIQVPTSTLDKKIEQYGQPKYIKIDVEGFEYNVLKGLTNPVDYISIEFTPELYSNSEKCIDYLHDLNQGECEYNYVYRENDHYYFDSWQNIESIKNYLSNVNDFVYEFGDIYIKSL
jgi:FkbM family methyltransferase